MKDKKKVEKVNKTPIDGKLLITVEEAASYTGLSARYIANLTREPDCSFVMRPPVRGRKTMLVKDKFDAYLNLQ